MPKRVVWASFGYMAGLGSSVYVQRRVRRTMNRYTPEQLRQQVGDRTREMADRARKTVIDLRDAAEEGRAAMRESEHALRAEFDQRPGLLHRGHRTPNSHTVRAEPQIGSRPTRPRRN